jgi:hydroxymethylpyrimidine/phosphomethylpyrimidine kinase
MPMARAVEPCALTIAGSDSGGNAGVQADLRAFHCYGIHGCTVFAALTAQNPSRIDAVMPVPPDFISAQLDSVFEAYSVKALKTGMLGTVEAIEAVAECLRSRPRVKKVVDPVMVATSGARLLAEDAVEAMKRLLLPLATVVTPNLPEAEVLLGRRIERGADIPAAAKELSRMFGCAMLVKGGHAVEHGAARRGLGERTAVDVLFDGRCTHVLSRPVVERPVSTHGTGCTFAAALAAELALGSSLSAAAEGAKNFVYESIRLSYYISRHCGVLGMPRKGGSKDDRGN